MKVLQINTLSRHGSTGKICSAIQKLSEKNGIETYIACRYLGKGEISNREIEISTWFDTHFHNRMARVFLAQGTCSVLRTMLFLKRVKKLKPDIVHLHNLHGNYINIPMLFRFLKKYDKTTIWTLHDCWSFTGWCPHYTESGCEGWENECVDCPLKSKTWEKRKIHSMFLKKRQMILELPHLTLVTPSHWLSEETRKSYMEKVPVRVINNGIDLNVFHKCESKFRKEHQCENKHIVLGVAYEWNNKKGIDVFDELAKHLPDNYVIVLVGNAVQQIKSEKVIHIQKTDNQQQLAELYATSDVLFNPTREDTYPTVNMEALACGTPVVTFDVGGSPEIVSPKTGIIVQKDDISSSVIAIRKVCEDNLIQTDDCIAAAKNFSQQGKFQQYIDLYQEILNNQENHR